MKVEEYDPQYAGRNPKLTAWKQAKATELLDEPLFADLDAGETRETWYNVHRDPLSSCHCVTDDIFSLCFRRSFASTPTISTPRSRKGSLPYRRRPLARTIED